MSLNALMGKFTPNNTDLTKKIAEEKGSKNDSRMLNYFDLPFGAQMTVLFVPDAHGEAWYTTNVHSPARHNVKGMSKMAFRDSIGCTKNNCPICQRGFDLYNEAKTHAGTNPTEEKRIKALAKNWMSNDERYVSCIVLDSGVQVNTSDDGNMIKLLKIPFTVAKIITNGLESKQVKDFFRTPFVIKKTHGNRADVASYESSYWDIAGAATIDSHPIWNSLTADMLEPLDIPAMVNTYNELYIKPVPTDEEANEWLRKVDESLAARTTVDQQGGAPAQGGYQQQQQQPLSAQQMAASLGQAAPQMMQQSTPQIPAQYQQASQQPEVMEDVPMNLGQPEENQPATTVTGEQIHTPNSMSSEELRNRLRQRAAN